MNAERTVEFGGQMFTLYRSENPSSLGAAWLIHSTSPGLSPPAGPFTADEVRGMARLLSEWGGEVTRHPAAESPVGLIGLRVRWDSGAVVDPARRRGVVVEYNMGRKVIVLTDDDRLVVKDVEGVVVDRG